VSGWIATPPPPSQRTVPLVRVDAAVDNQVGKEARGAKRGSHTDQTILELIDDQGVGALGAARLEEAEGHLRRHPGHGYLLALGWRPGLSS
jgi:hypothetical protein